MEDFSQLSPIKAIEWAQKKQIELFNLKVDSSITINQTSLSLNYHPEGVEGKCKIVLLIYQYGIIEEHLNDLLIFMQEKSREAQQSI